MVYSFNIGLFLALGVEQNRTSLMVNQLHTSATVDGEMGIHPDNCINLVLVVLIEVGKACAMIIHMVVVCGAVEFVGGAEDLFSKWTFKFF